MTARGNPREALFFDDTDQRRFLGLLAELPERLGLEAHAFVQRAHTPHKPTSPTGDCFGDGS